MVRWGNFDEASTWIAQESVETFLTHAVSRPNLRFTNYDIIRKALDPRASTAAVTVRYEMYLADELISWTIIEKQRWQFNQAAERWELNTNLFEAIEAATQK